MKIGTKSVLFGAHQFAIHPWFVAFGWWALYGFPFDPRLWLCFFLHDFGYFGKPNMDGPEGERHPEWGAKIMGVFGPAWHREVLFHSRFYAAKFQERPSRLCMADKMALYLTPAWIYLPLVNLSGEVYEYMALTDTKYKHEMRSGLTQRQWHADMVEYCKSWALEHADGRPDHWTKVAGSPKNNLK